MARKFNGTSDKSSVALNLSAFSLLSLSFWLWWDAFANNDHMAMEFGSPNAQAVSGFYVDPNAADGKFQVFFSDTVVGRQLDYTRPSPAAWHHYAIVMQRSSTAATITTYIDGAAASGTSSGGNPGGNFANSTLFVMNRNNASLFGPGRIAELAMWGAVTITASEAKALSVGGNPNSVHPDGLTFYAPFYGDSPEPDYSGHQKSVTLVGTSIVAHPGVRQSFYVPSPSPMQQPPGPPVRPEIVVGQAVNRAAVW